MNREKAILLIEEEFLSASKRYPPFNSAHEGKSVIEEEYDELWDEIKLSPNKRRPEQMRAECVQLAAMALRFLVDCC